MFRHAVGILAASPIAIALAGSCAPPVPKPLDVASYPSARTSAEPLFVSNMPPPEASHAAPAASSGVGTHEPAPVLDAGDGDALVDR